MTLYDLKQIELNLDYDLTDDDYDSFFYEDIQDIQDNFAKKIKVVEICSDFVVCDFYGFMVDNKFTILDYLYDNLNEIWASYYNVGIFEKKDDEIISDFIQTNLSDLLVNYKDKRI